MSCDVASAAFLFFASTAPAPQGMPAAPVPAVAAAPVSVAGEPLFKDIVGRADALKAQVEAYRKQAAGSAGSLALPKFDMFTSSVGQLSALDEQAHKLLVARGAVDDLKCILHGISQDLPAKLAALADAKTTHDQDQALRDMAYLLNDNVEVITAPPTPPA